MDRTTLDAYDRHAADYAREWDEQPAPDDMYALLERYFKPGPTADVGCGTLYLSWRVTTGDALRDGRGRLYEVVDAERVHAALGDACDVLFEHEQTSESSGKRVHRLVARRRATAAG